MELKRLTEAPYSVKVKLKDPDGQEEEVKVFYKPVTSAMLKEIDAIRADPDRTIIDQALLLIRELPDITDAGQPVTVDRALFESMDVRHVSNIVQAVTDNFFGVEPTDQIPTDEGIDKARREQESREREQAESAAAAEAANVEKEQATAAG
jgi:hypothetical protein